MSYNSELSTKVNLEVLRNLDMRSLRHYSDLLLSIHKRTEAEAVGISIPAMTALSYRVTRKVSTIASDRPVRIVEKILKRTRARSEYVALEVNCLEIFQNTLNAPCLVEDPNSEEAIDIEMDIRTELVKLLYTYEDFLPLELNLTAFTEILMNRENIMRIIRGEPLRNIRQHGFRFNVSLDYADMIYRIVESSHWPCLVHYLKRGAGRRTKRQRTVLREVFNAITKIRMHHIEKGMLSHVLDQTGYDIDEDDVDSVFKPTNEVNVDNMLDSIINEMGPDIEEHFEGSLDLGMLLVGILDIVKLMGVEDVCLVHHYSDN